LSCDCLAEWHGNVDCRARAFPIKIQGRGIATLIALGAGLLFAARHVEARQVARRAED